MLKIIQSKDPILQVFFEVSTEALRHLYPPSSNWRAQVKKGQMLGDSTYTTNMIFKDEKYETSYCTRGKSTHPASIVFSADETEVRVSVSMTHREDIRLNIKKLGEHNGMYTYEVSLELILANNGEVPWVSYPRLMALYFGQMGFTFEYFETVGECSQSSPLWVAFQESIFYWYLSKGGM